jgi:hypothetical protein
VVFAVSGLPVNRVTRATISVVRSYFGGLNNDGLPKLLKGQRRVKPYEVEYSMHTMPFQKRVCGFYWSCLDLTPRPRMLPIN